MSTLYAAPVTSGDNRSSQVPTPFERLFGFVMAGVFLTLLSIILVARLPLRDPDVWWHLVMGHEYLDGASVRHPGPMSPLGTEDWHSRDWLPQIVMARFDESFGLAGVAWLHGLALTALFITCYRLCRRAAPFGPAVVAAGTAFFGMLGSLSARPQVVSFLLLAVTVGALVQTVDDRRPRWWLAPLTAFWACSHGMWFLSPVLQLVVMLGLIIDGRLGRQEWRPHAVLVLMSLLAVGLTPNGLHLLTHPLGSSMGIAHYIQEYQPTAISNPPYAATLAMFALVFVSWARRSRPSWVEVLLVGTALFAVLYTGRTIALGAVIVAPFFAKAAAAWWPRSQAALPPRVERVVVVVGAVSVLAALALMVPHSADRPSAYFPSEFDSKLRAIPADAVLVNELGDGGYLAWKYPDLKIVGDGLTDQYAVEWLDDWYSALLGGSDWRSFVKNSDADYALLHESTPLRLGLQADGWAVLQHAQGRILMQAPAG